MAKNPDGIAPGWCTEEELGEASKEWGKIYNRIKEDIKDLGCRVAKAGGKIEIHNSKGEAIDFNNLYIRFAPTEDK